MPPEDYEADAATARSIAAHEAGQCDPDACRWCRIEADGIDARSFPDPEPPWPAGDEAEPAWPPPELGGEAGGA